MKRLTATSAMAIALAISANSANAADFDAGPIIQELVVSGVVESWNGYTFRSGDGTFGPDDDDFFVSGIDGMLSLPLGSNFSIQTDVAIEYTEKAFDDANAEDTYQYGGQFGTHFTYRDPESFALGAFGAFGRGQGDNVRTDVHAVGGEAQLYLNDFTLYVQGGFMDADIVTFDPDDAFQDAVFVRGVGRWHMSPDSRLQAEFAYANGEQDTDAKEMEIFEWGVRYDMVLAGLPLIGDTQMFLGYRGVHADNGSGVDTGDFTEHTIMVGTSHSFGGSTIKEVERYGAGLDLPDFVRWGSYGDVLD